ncbi:MAG: hypothetical protein ACE14V_04860 [bacterium]
MPISRRKSPVLARLLSLIPGLGHVYAGAVVSGILWLICSGIVFYIGWYLLKILFWFLLLFIMFIYAPLVSYCANSAATICTDLNVRKAMVEELRAAKKTREKIAGYKDNQ